MCKNQSNNIDLLIAIYSKIIISDVRIILSV